MKRKHPNTISYLDLCFSWIPSNHDSPTSDISNWSHFGVLNSQTLSGSHNFGYFDFWPPSGKELPASGLRVLCHEFCPNPDAGLLEPQPGAHGVPIGFADSVPFLTALKIVVRRTRGFVRGASAISGDTPSGYLQGYKSWSPSSFYCKLSAV